MVIYITQNNYLKIWSFISYKTITKNIKTGSKLALTGKAFIYYLNSYDAHTENGICRKTVDYGDIEYGGYDLQLSLFTYCGCCI